MALPKSLTTLIAAAPLALGTTLGLASTAPAATVGATPSHTPRPGSGWDGHPNPAPGQRAVLKKPAVGARSATALRAGYFGRLRNENTHACIDDSFGYGLREFPCNGLSYQNWSISPGAGTAWTLTDANTNRCIDDSPVGLRSLGCNGLNYQQWRWYNIYDRTTGNYLWSVFQNANTGRCVDDSPVGLRSFPCNGLNYQGWNA